MIRATLRLALMTLAAFCLSPAGAAQQPPSFEQTNSLDAAPRAVFSVNILDDAPDAHVNDGKCESTFGVGKCTLRAAIQQLNDFGGGSINLPPGTYTLSRMGADDTGTNGDLDVTGNIIIIGTGASASVVDAASTDRILDIRPGASLSLQNLELKNGSTTGALNDDMGGGIRLGTGASLTMNRVNLHHNSADNWGGGIAVADHSIVNITESIVSHNSAQQIGGIGNLSGEGASYFITDSAISSNTLTNPSGVAGGIRVFQSALVMENTTVADNGPVSPAAPAYGGGIVTANQSLIPVLRHVTITGNRSGRGGGLANSGPTPPNVENSIIAGNTSVSTGPDCANVGISLALNSTQRNLIGNNGGCPDLNAALSLIGDPVFLPPQTVGPAGTLVVPIAGTSPALNAATGPCSGHDQRLLARPQGQGCDLGAFERLAGVQGALTVDEILVIPGDPLHNQFTVTVTDPDALSSTFAVTLTTAAGDQETYLLNGSGATRTMAVAVESGPPFSGNDGWLRASPGDTISVRYSDETIPSGGALLLQADVFSLLPLLQNAGFENDGVCALSPWKSKLGKDKSKAKNPYAGSCAFTFKGTPEKLAAPGTLKQTQSGPFPSFATGDQLWFIGYARPHPATVAQVKVTAKYSDGAKDSSGLGSIGGGGSGQYQQITASLTLDLTGRTVKKLVVKFTDRSTSGKWMLDEVQLGWTRTATTRAETAGGLLPPPAAPEVPDGFRQ